MGYNNILKQKQEVWSKYKSFLKLKLDIYL